MKRYELELTTITAIALVLLLSITTVTAAPVQVVNAQMFQQFCTVAHALAQGPHAQMFQQFCTVAHALAQGPHAQMFQQFCTVAHAGGVCVPITSSTTTNGVCGTNSVLQNGVCVPTTTTNGVCGINSILQNGVCVPTHPITCPSGTVLENEVCVPITSTTTNSVCGTNAILQNGVCVPINPTQSAPVANAGQAQTVVQGSTVTLDGSGSHATTTGATIVSYSWTQLSQPFVTLNGASMVSPTFIAPHVTTAVSITFSLTVTDSNGLVSTPISTTVTVTPS